MEAEVAVAGGLAKRGERRAHERLAVNEQAILRFVTSGAQVPCRIVDVSLTGCRLQTAARFPVGIYTRVEAEFRLAGIALRLSGVTQAIHGRCEVGIRFLDLSERKRGQVRELIEEILKK